MPSYAAFYCLYYNEVSPIYCSKVLLSEYGVHWVSLQTLIQHL